MILNNKSLLLTISALNKGLFNVVAWIISQPPIRNKEIDDKIDKITAIITMNLVLQSSF